MTSTQTAVIEVDMARIEDILLRARGSLPAEDLQLLRDLLESHRYLTDLIGDRETTISRLRNLLFGTKTETKENVQRKMGTPPLAKEGAEESPAEKGKRKGHGRIPASAYTGAETVAIPHESLKPGDRCPKAPCPGTVYQKEPVVFVRICGCAPFAAKRYERGRLRCGLCGTIFKAAVPREIGEAESKFDETVTSMVAVLRYGYGLPMNRIEDLQDSFGVPFPASTQWDLLAEGAKKLEPALDELVRQAAQGSVVMNDDTPMKILDILLEEKRRRDRGEKPSDRTGIYTSGIVSDLTTGERVVLYFTGKQHAGENLAKVMAEREGGLDPPIQMCDGLRHNTPPEFAVILSNCLTHARRHFVDVASSFPDEVKKVIDDLAIVYENDAHTKGISGEDRLRYHQEHSAPVMAGLKTWMETLLSEKKAEPNSRLGKAIKYSLDRWDQLTLFLSKAGAPLDNSLTERMLKRAIRHRRNSLFYRTQNGASVGDLYMSLIATTKLAKADPFDYLNELQRHAEEVADNPSAWMPWNYPQTLRGTTHAAD